MITDKEEALIEDLMNKENALIEDLMSIVKRKDEIIFLLARQLKEKEVELEAVQGKLDAVQDMCQDMSLYV